VKESIVKAIGFAALLATLVFVLLFLFPTQIAELFLSNRPDLSLEELAINNTVLEKVGTAMRWVFGATPIIALQLIGAAYFQAIGKVKPALWLTLLRQGIIFIPTLYLMAALYEEQGVWQSFFIADVLATIITAYFLIKEVRKTLISS
jgi:Na+-driven multidrug efflux pump